MKIKSLTFMLINKRFFYVLNFSLLHIILRYFKQKKLGMHMNILLKNFKLIYQLISFNFNIQTKCKPIF
jgi:hypothetical protein